MGKIGIKTGHTKSIGRTEGGTMEVDVEIRASTSNYWALLTFVDKSGQVHKKEINGEHKGTINGNYLTALIEAYKALNRPCMVTVYADSDYIVASFQNGWVDSWMRHNWKNAKGRTVRNVELWQELKQAMRPHSSRFIYRREKK